MGKIQLDSLFSGLQNQMIAQLNTSRNNIEHPGSKGDVLEMAWIEWLRKYLPNRYSVDKAIVIDHTGKTSDQIDIVIYDNWYTPFIFTQNGFYYIPAEGVYAVFEVKPEMKGKVTIDYSAKKIESVRVLKRTSTKIINTGVDCLPRPLTKIVGGVLTSTCSVTKDTINRNLELQKGLSSIDFGCIADEGSFYIDYNGDENTKNKEYESRIREYYDKREFVSVTYSKKENSLVTFFMQLTRYLQQAIGTVAAIDLQKYIGSIDEKIDEEI